MKESAIIAAATVTRRIFRAPALFVNGLLCLILVVQTCALPIPLAFLFVDTNARIMSEGCKTKVCCTALCYLDKDGVHHCVHKHEDSCTCSESTGDLDPDPLLHPTLGMLPEIGQPLPVFAPIDRVFRTSASVVAHIPATPSPPPRMAES